MKQNWVKVLRYLVGFTLVFIAAYLITRYWNQLHYLRYNDVKKYILSYGRFAAVCFVILYALKPIVFVIPASLLSILAGNIFGPIEGLILSLIGCFFSGTLAFYLSKFLGKPFVDKILRGKALELNNDFEEQGFQIMLIMRLTIIFPYDALSYAAGMTKMRYKDFIFATLLGILPEMVCYSFMGGNIKNPFSVKFFLPIVSAVVIAIIAYSFYKAINKQ